MKVNSRSILMDLGEIELCSGCALTLDLNFSHIEGLMLGPNAVLPFTFIGCEESASGFMPAVEAASDFSGATNLNEIILQSQLPLEFKSALNNETGSEYTIGGEVSHMTGNALNLNGLVLPVQFSPWVKDASGPWIQVPFDEFELQCVALRDPATRQDFCDAIDFKTTEEGVDIVFGNMILCPSCSLIGDENGVMFTIRHKDGRELDFRAPIILTPSLSGSVDMGGEIFAVDAGAREALLQRFCEGLLQPGQISRSLACSHRFAAHVRGTDELHHARQRPDRGGTGFPATFRLGDHDRVRLQHALPTGIVCAFPHAPDGFR